MSNILTKATVLVLNRNRQAIDPDASGPQEAFRMMATNAATGLEFEGEDHPSFVALLGGAGIDSPAPGLDEHHTVARELRRVDIRPGTWDERIGSLCAQEV